MPVSETEMSRRGQRAPVRSTELELLLRVVWWTLVGTALFTFLASLRPFHRLAVGLEPGLSGSSATLGVDLEAGLVQLGLTASTYGTYVTAVLVLFTGGYVSVGTYLFLRRPRDPVALLVSLWLVVFGATFTPVTRALSDSVPALVPLVDLLSGLSFILFFLLFYLFPDWRFVPGWTRWPAALFVLLTLLSTVAPGTLLDLNIWPWHFGTLLFLALALSMIYAQVFRYRIVSGPVERQQTKWAVFGLMVALVSFAVAAVLDQLLAGSLQPENAVLWDLAYGHLLTFGFLAVPASIAVAVLRHRLWEVDELINRALVYISLTVASIALYALVAGYLGTLLDARGSFPVSLVAAGVVAVAFAPLRERLQGFVNRFIYGDRDDPYRLLSRLGRLLQGSVPGREALGNLALVVAAGMKLPYVAIDVPHGDGRDLGASVGSPGPESLVLTLRYNGETTGSMKVTPRGGAAGFSRRDIAVLEDVARQAGAAAHAAKLTDDLQQSRQRLVESREEERRRLRRELHDGLGPRLAAHSLKAGSARLVYARDALAGDEMLSQLEREIAETLAEVRRLVYQLRPPALDEFGLVGALDGVVKQYGSEDLHVEFEASGEVSGLPAAVEVAAYRIVSESLTNVVRHAGASRCSVSLSLTVQRLLLRVDDDGRGPEGGPAGVGLRSMRERAAELGGSLSVGSSPLGGTRVELNLPVAGPQ
ncbi:MAG TPA: sensor histidine kinase [Trueperaceae bacterium]